MNKKEQAEMARLRDELRLAKAFRITDPVEPDVIPPDSVGIVKGFLFNEYRNYEKVVPACSGSSSHGFGFDDRTTTQGSRRLYSTRLLALRGLRNAVELNCVKQLADVDALIEKEQETP